MLRAVLIGVPSARCLCPSGPIAGATLSPTPSTPPLTARPTLTSAARAAGADGAAPSSAASTVPPPASEPVEAIQIRIPGSRAALEASFVESFGGGGEPAGLAELAGASIVPPMPGCGEGVAFTADANVESDACDTFCETTVWVGTPPPPGYVAPPATPTVAAMIAEAVVASAADVPAAAAARTRPPALVQKLKYGISELRHHFIFIVWTVHGFLSPIPTPRMVYSCTLPRTLGANWRLLSGATTNSRRGRRRLVW